MPIEIKVSILVVATGIFILGVLGNGFIGLVNCIEWFRTGNVSSADFILTSLAMARIIQLLVMLLDSFILGLAPHLYATGKLAKVVPILWALTNHLTTWFATCLSVFYFLKIANFSHSFFMWLKWRVNRVVLLLFLGSIPFFLSLISLFLLFLSLVRHTKNFQLNMMGSVDSSTEAHRSAMKMVTTFLLLFIIYFISILTAIWSSTNVETYQIMMLVIVLSSTFPSGHSFLIIFGNSKLRQTALRLLWQLYSLRKSKV
ncbi:Taste receptor type 2 member 42 [Myotis davidii]|uniref:Taste receptor type 2 member 42 n=1 Tax=Myotis davidii TaxID=225400 RepID=L5LWD5_MYODS|nr:Taste receptor type 2 member 42 [Myotis davidii]